MVFYKHVSFNNIQYFQWREDKPEARYLATISAVFTILFLCEVWSYNVIMIKLITYENCLYALLIK